MFTGRTRWCSAFFRGQYEECIKRGNNPFVPRSYARLEQWQECRDSLHMLPEGLEHGLLKLICDVGLLKQPPIRIEREPVEMTAPINPTTLLLPEPKDDPFTPFVREAEERNSLHALTLALMWRCRANVAAEAWNEVVSDATKAMLLDVSSCADMAPPSATLVRPDRIRCEWSALNLRAYGFLRTNREELCDHDLSLARLLVEEQASHLENTDQESTDAAPRTQWARVPEKQAQFETRRRALLKGRVPWPE